MLNDSYTKRNQKDNEIIRVDDLWHRQQISRSGEQLLINAQTANKQLLVMKLNWSSLGWQVTKVEWNLQQGNCIKLRDVTNLTVASFSSRG